MVVDFQDSQEGHLDTMFSLDGTPSTWDELRWLDAFRDAVRRGDGFRPLRAEVFRHTCDVVRRGNYRVDGHNVQLRAVVPLESHASFYTRPEPLDAPDLQSRVTTAVIVQNADCVEVAQLLREAGFRPAVLNMANRQTPGGGVLGGAGAQEENLFRRSDLFVSLYPFVDFCEQYGLVRDRRHSYPLDRRTGGIHSPDVTFFRASEANGYRLLKVPFSVSVITVPAINGPELVAGPRGMRIVDSLVEPTREKIRTILRIAGSHRHDALVLGAFGCGAFRNPPAHVAELFAEVFCEPEFDGRFRVIQFAILDDHNSRKAHNPDGNVLPFLRVFG